MAASEHLELSFDVTDTDPEYGVSVRQHIEGAERLRRHERTFDLRSPCRPTAHRAGTTVRKQLVDSDGGEAGDLDPVDQRLRDSPGSAAAWHLRTLSTCRKAVVTSPVSVPMVTAWW